jgi:hypothetical protein
MAGFIGSTNLRASKNGVSVGQAAKINFIEGSNVTLTVVDDSVNDEVDVTIDAAGGSVSDGDKGDITVSASGATWTIDSDAVTFAKIQNITDSRLLGRSAGSDGDCQEITIGANLTLSAGTLSATGGGGVSDGDKGDITVAVSGTEWTINAGAVAETELATNAVTEAKIANSAVINNKIADGAVDNDKIADDSIGDAKLYDLGIPTSKLADLAVTREKIAHSAITGKAWAFSRGYVRW